MFDILGEELKSALIIVGFGITILVIGMAAGQSSTMRPSVVAVQVDQSFCDNDYCRKLLKEYIENNRKEDK